jgi:hypothetical protein
VATPEPLPGKDALGGYAKTQPTAKPAKPKYLEQIRNLDVPYQQGEKVVLKANDQEYEVAGCTHSHVELKGKKYAVRIDEVEPAF